MDISIFEVTGPVMIGPSSSHTAGAARLSRIARLIVADPFTHVSFGLHGSFAKTYKGHGTDSALVAGALGFYEDDERLARSFELAKKEGIGFDFYETELDGMHENSVKMTFTMKDGTEKEIMGSSIGGAQIIITKINGFDTEFTAQSTTLVISHNDRVGMLGKICAVLADYNINIGIMKLSRRAKGDVAFCIIETDDIISDEVVKCLKDVTNIKTVQAINLVGKEED